MPRLIGERIILREYKKEDLYSIRKWVNDDEITRFLSDNFIYPHTLNDTEKFLNSMLESTTDARGFVIAKKDTEEYIGQIDLIKIDWLNESVSLAL